MLGWFEPNQTRAGEDVGGGRAEAQDSPRFENKRFVYIFFEIRKVTVKKHFSPIDWVAMFIVLYVWNV